MAAQSAFDPVRATYAACLECFEAQRTALAAKGIHGKSGLLDAIKRDLAKLTLALAEARDRPADCLLAEFFAEAPEVLPGVLAHLRPRRIFHVGFEIAEPMNLMAQGLAHWIAKADAELGIHTEIARLQRFPASAALQRRVGAPTEIMHLALRVDGKPLALELFDVQGPGLSPQDLGLKAPRHREGPFAQHRHPRALTTPGEIFRGDRLWHYALRADGVEAVRQIDHDFQGWASAHPCYRLPYREPVENRHEGTLHTKLINTARGLELEFTTETADAPHGHPSEA